MSTPLEAFRAALEAAQPGILSPKMVFYRVVREVAGRLSLQKMHTRDEAPDAFPIDVWPGVPGATSKPTPGEIVIVAFVGEDQAPVVIARAANGEPGHIPLDVLLDATRAIGLLTRGDSSGAKVTIGGVPATLAKAAGVQSFFAAVKVFATAAKISTDPTLAAAALALETSLGTVTIDATTMLEAT